MKRFMTIAMVGTVLALSACADNTGADYTYETQAPYASERTAGAVEEKASSGAAVFQKRQRK